MKIQIKNFAGKKIILSISTLVTFAALLFAIQPGFFSIQKADATCTAGPNNFCASQIISSAILSFIYIPSSFSFSNITVSSSAQSTFSNSGGSQPDGGDLLGVEDTRDSGGFDVQIQTNGTFADTTGDSIPVSNLYVATSTSSPVYTIAGAEAPATYPATNYGVVYSAGATQKGVTASLDNHGNDLGSVSTFSTNLSGGAVVLMNGQLPVSQGRNSNMYQYISYYLNVPPLQPAGQYAVTLTYTLLDDTN